MSRKSPPTAAQWQQISTYLQQADPHEIYRLHMAQARQTRKMFANDPEAQSKIDTIEAKIKLTYRQACQEAAE